MTPEEIRAARTAYPLSTAELAARLGVSAVTVRNWEAGRRTPEPHRLRALEIVFGLRKPPPGTWACQATPEGCACRCHAIAAGRKPGDRGPLKSSWRPAELSYLRLAVERGDLPDEIGAHLAQAFGRPRSRKAVVDQAQELGLSWRAGWYSEAEVVRILGVARRRVVRWRQSGVLRAGRSQQNVSGVDSRWWRISVDALGAFVRLHAGRDLDPAGIRDRALRAQAEVAAAVNRRAAG